MKKDARVDAYIAKAPAYARPIIEEFREIVHRAAPDISENIKWGAPAFELNGIVCQIAAFKNYCSIHFWNHGAILPNDDESRFGKLTSVRDLGPKQELIELVAKAAKLNADGVKPVRKPAAKKPPFEVPAELTAALAKNKKAKAAFDAFPPSHQREYAEWIGEARRAETREKRVAQAIEWIAEGKSRNWKYERK